MGPRDPWSELNQLQERLHDLLEQATGGRRGGVGTGPAWRPVIDLVESPDAYLVFAELPGVDREDVELRSEGHWLEISGHRRPDPAAEQGFLRLESAQGPFRRRIELPGLVAADRIEARLVRGLLEIRAPKVRGASEIPVREEGAEG